MPLMANLMLSTRRPIINHPHYEDVELRARTRLVYQMYSRRDPEDYHRTMRNMGASYVNLSSGWCLDMQVQNSNLDNNFRQISLCPSFRMSVKLQFLQSCHKMSQIKVAWYVLKAKDMHSGSRSDP